MRIKTKSEEDARFICGALSTVGIEFDYYYGRGSGFENGPVRGYWTIIILRVRQDYEMVRSWFPDRPFIYSDTPKETVWKKSQDIDEDLAKEPATVRRWRTMTQT